MNQYTYTLTDIRKDSAEQCVAVHNGKRQGSSQKPAGPALFQCANKCAHSVLGIDTFESVMLKAEGLGRQPDRQTDRQTGRQAGSGQQVAAEAPAGAAAAAAWWTLKDIAFNS